MSCFKDDMCEKCKFVFIKDGKYEGCFLVNCFFETRLQKKDPYGELQLVLDDLLSRGVYNFD